MSINCIWHWITSNVWYAIKPVIGLHRGIIIIIIYSFKVFHISVSWLFITGVLVTASLLNHFKTLPSILAVLNKAVFWMVSPRPPTSKSSSPFNNPLVTVPEAPITIDKIVTFIFHSFFNSLGRSRHLSFKHSFTFILWSAWTVKSTIVQILFFFFL